ncbi:MAG: undecaprenyl-diphosphate phosphatase [Pseudomonadota bacterium]
MISTIKAIFLGIVQGSTEFLPVSSSGHLVLFQNLLGLKEPELLLDISLHLGTLLAVCLYFHSDLTKMIKESWTFAVELLKGRKSFSRIAETPYASFTLWVIVGTIPTALIGISFRSTLEGLFDSVPVVGIMLLCTGAILAISGFISKNRDGRLNIGLFAALAVGLAQGFAIIPGISRSGATIVCGMACGLKRDVAARFSFLLSIPAILGALVLQLSSEARHEIAFLPLLAGLIAATLVGLAALKVLMGMVTKGNLFWFAPYCWGLGLLMLFL